MLTERDESTVLQTAVSSSAGSTITDSEAGGKVAMPIRGRSRLARALRVEWLGQTAASLCWISSVLTAGISSRADWLQLLAACSWLLANIASVASAEDD